MATPNIMGSCPKPMKATSEGAWHGESPLDFALPLAILQICLVVVFTRILAMILKPLRQPRVIAEIIGGILLGPSALGRNKRFIETVFPARSLTVLDTLANIGLIFFLFLVGLELDIRAIRRTGSKALAIAAAGISLPFAMGIGTSVVLRKTISKGVPPGPFLVFMGVSLSITAFPVLARILAELKLLTTDIGRMAMSAAAINDVAAWVLLALAIALSSTDSSPLISLWVLLSGAAFVIFAMFIIKPVLAAMAKRSIQGEPVKEIYICATLTVVLASAFATDTIGIHALFGAFIIGIIVPKEGPFAGVMIEKIEDLVSILLLPLYFVSSGLKTNVLTIRGGQSWGLLVLVISTACFGKIAGTFLVSLMFHVPCREALALGLLMNTKGLVELIVLNIGKDKKVLNDQTFAILVLMALFTTFITTPLVTAIYKPARKTTPYKRRTMEDDDPKMDLRILACFHSTRNIPTMINLLECSRGTSCHGMIVYAMHLMELSERSSAISTVHKARRNGLPFWNKKGNDSDQVAVAFEAYQQLSKVIIRPMTAISELSSIHEDICSSAHQKRAATIILPFHKRQRLDGVMESLGDEFRLINERVLRHAPCSVGILVDRGLGGTTQISPSDISFTATVIFVGGRDDREAIAYSSRIAEHPGVKVTVVRLVAEAGKSLRWDKGESAKVEADETSVEDGESIREIQSKRNGDVPLVSYIQKEVGSKDDVIQVIKEMSRCNLFLVGRMLPISRLTRKDDSPELGPIGSFLVSPDFTSTTTSVLVLQQYNPTKTVESEEEEDELESEMSDSPSFATPPNDSSRQISGGLV